MSDQEWHFRLHGDAFDLNGIADLFSDEATIVKDERDQMELVCDQPAEAGSQTCAVCRVLYDRWSRGKVEQREASRRIRRAKQRERSAPMWSDVIAD
jgi:hypothetical protein